MCDVFETGIGREISCADKRRTVMNGAGIMVNNCILSYASISDDTCPVLPSGTHVAFSKENADHQTRAKLEDSYCFKCPFRANFKGERRSSNKSKT